MSEWRELRDADGKLIAYDKVFTMTPYDLLAQQQQAQQNEQFQKWADNVNDNLSALIAIVTQMAGMDEQEYKAVVLRIRAMRDQIHAEERDAKHEPA